MSASTVAAWVCGAGGAAALAAVTLLGAGSPDSTMASHDTGLHVAKVDLGHDPNMVIDKINGEVPPGRATFAASQKDAVRGTDADGNVYLTHYTVRAVGTRSPVHEHQYGGTTCMLSGEMTLYLEGSEPARKTAGECYFMPAGKLMSGVNSGSVDAVMFDVFVIPKNGEEWVQHELDDKGGPKM